MFGKENHGPEARGKLPDEARVFGEPLDAAFVAAVEEDGAKPLCAHPVLGVDQIPMLELRGVREAEVVKPLSEISGFVSDFRLLLLPVRRSRFWRSS